MPNDRSRARIAEALRAAARDVEERLTSAWEGFEVLSAEEKARATAALSAFGHEFDSLAAASETASVYAREFEVIRDELQARKFTLTPAVAQAVADAFEAGSPAHTPAQRRSKAAHTSASRP